MAAALGALVAEKNVHHDEESRRIITVG